ncbi:GTP cyclohydrolase II [Nocardia heshunensis]
MVSSRSVVEASAAERLGEAEPVEPEHWLTRRGAELRVRVELLDAGADSGSILIFGDLGDARANGVNPLVRLHSRCLYGDALGSDDCDCGPELQAAMNMIQDEGVGVLCYLEQEGRGEGLLVKAQGLNLSERKGLNTFDSYTRLGKDQDSRSFDAAADYLRNKLNLTSVRLMTNSPYKVDALADAGLRVERVPLETVPRSDRARCYLEAKRAIRGHQLDRALREAEEALEQALHEAEETLHRNEDAFRYAHVARQDPRVDHDHQMAHEPDATAARPHRSRIAAELNSRAVWTSVACGSVVAACLIWLVPLGLPASVAVAAVGVAGFAIGRGSGLGSS